MKIDKFEVTCEGAPLQIEGTLENGRSFYFRARHRTMRLEIDDVQIFTVTSYAPDDPHIFSGLSDPDWAILLINGLLDQMK
jgi:hypothetical protein